LVSNPAAMKFLQCGAKPAHFAHSLGWLSSGRIFMRQMSSL
jgi:hypothetical protein